MSSNLPGTVIKSYIIGNTYSAIKQCLDTYTVYTNLDSSVDMLLLQTKNLNTAKDTFYQAVGSMFMRLNDLDRYDPN